MRKLFCFLAFVLLGSGLALAQRPGGFEVLGPGGGGAMFHPLVSPHDAATALVACDMTGAYITHDGGRSWRMFNLRGVIRFFVFDPSFPGVIYAQNNNLWRSRDNGATWSLVWPAASGLQGISMASDHSDESVVSAHNPLDTITALAIDPHDSDHLYASAGGTSPGLFESADAGVHWTRTVDLPELANRMWIRPGPAKSLLAAGQHYVVERSGAKLHVFPAPSQILDSSAGITGKGAWVLYAATPSGISISDDTGATWINASLPGSGAQVRAVATSFHYPDVAYASYNDLHLDGSVWHGVARTRNVGKTWDIVWKEGTSAAPTMQDAWITARFGTDWGENPLNMTVADHDANLVYGTDFGRTLISPDGGGHWHAAYSRQTPDGGWASTGLDATTIYGIHFDPFDARRQFITYTDISLFRSENGGKSWLSSSTGVPKAWLNTAYWMVFDPQVKGRAWAVYSGTHDLPRSRPLFGHGRSYSGIHLDASDRDSRSRAPLHHRSARSQRQGFDLSDRGQVRLDTRI